MDSLRDALDGLFAPEVAHVSRGEIPAFLSIDVEPDGFQVPEGQPATWTGWDAAEPFVERIRDALTEVEPVAPRFVWYLRMDPQLAVVSPGIDHVATGFPDRLRRLERRGDVFGLHVHPVRWSEARGRWIHDYEDEAWTAHCLERGAEAYAAAFGAGPLRTRYGAGYLSTALVGQLEELGVRVDTTPEPRTMSTERRAHPVDVESGIDSTPRLGALPEASRIPPSAYRPSRLDGLRPDDADGRQIVLVPVTAARRRYERPRWWRAASRARHGLRGPPVRTMYPSVCWSPPSAFWDIVEQEVARMPRPYVSIAYRTDAPGSSDARNAQAVIGALASHRLARRLRFCDPLEVAPALLPARARAGLTWADSPVGLARRAAG